MEEQYNEFLNECYDNVVIGGITFTPSEILKKCDPVAYACSLSDFEDSEGYEEE